jgi:hypothetical protein
MRAVTLLLFITAMAEPAPPPTVPARIRLKDGTVYRLKEPPFLKDGRFIFTTTDGKFYSLAEKEVDEIQLVGPTPKPRTQPNAQDSRALGEIAREERHKTGKRAPVAPAPTPRPSRADSPP